MESTYRSDYGLSTSQRTKPYERRLSIRTPDQGIPSVMLFHRSSGRNKKRVA
jgi:hypothetical protein